MNQKNKILISLSGIIVICGLLATKFSGQIFNSSNIVEASDSNNKQSYNKENRVNNKKVYSNSVQDKKALLNLMVNSVCYYSTASGNFDYYSANAETDMTIDFSVDLLNNKSYEKHLFKNLKNRSNSEPFEETSYNGNYYCVYRSDGYIEALTSEMEKSNDKVEYVQFSSRKMSMSNDVARTTRAYETYEDSTKNVDGQEVYARRNDTSMMGVSATVLLPEDFAMNFMTSDLDNWKIIGNESYLGRDTIVVETNLNAYYNMKHDAQKSIIRIDANTGIMLEANLYNSNGDSTFKIKMNKIILDESINSELFEKYSSRIKE